MPPCTPLKGWICNNTDPPWFRGFRRESATLADSNTFMGERDGLLYSQWPSDRDPPTTTSIQPKAQCKSKTQFFKTLGSCKFAFITPVRFFFLVTEEMKWLSECICKWAPAFSGSWSSPSSPPPRASGTRTISRNRSFLIGSLHQHEKWKSKTLMWKLI